MTNWIVKAANEIALEPGFLEKRKCALSNVQVIHAILEHLPDTKPLEEIIRRIEVVLAEYSDNQLVIEHYRRGDPNVSVTVAIPGAQYVALKKYLDMVSGNI